MKNTIIHFIISYLMIASLLFGIGVNIDANNSKIINNIYFQIFAVFIFIIYQTHNLFVTIITIIIFYYLVYTSPQGKKYFNLNTYNKINDILIELGFIDEYNEHNEYDEYMPIN